MSTVTIARKATSQEVVEALRNGLDTSYTVLPGMRIRRSPLFGKPRPGGPELIAVTAGLMKQAQVRITLRPERTDLQITAGGVLGDLLMNTFGIARTVQRALLDAPTLNATKPSR